MEKVISAFMAALCVMIGCPFVAVPPEIQDQINEDIFQRLHKIQGLDDRIDGLWTFICQFAGKDDTACESCRDLIKDLEADIARYEREIVLLRANYSPMYASYVAVASIFWGDCARSREAVI